MEIEIWIKDNESKVKVIPHLRRAIRFDHLLGKILFIFYFQVVQMKTIMWNKRQSYDLG